MDLPPNHEAFALFDQMQADEFVDKATRAVVIDMNLYNGPLKKFACVRLLYGKRTHMLHWLHWLDIRQPAGCRDCRDRRNCTDNEALVCRRLQVSPECTHLVSGRLLQVRHRSKDCGHCNVVLGDQLLLLVYFS